ncbi:MAG: hypothetical protein ACJ8AG_04445 [Ktedonobacteraceae bacterium]
MASHHDRPQNFWLLRAFQPGEDVEPTHPGSRFPVTAAYEDIVFPPEGESTQL